VNEKKVAGRHGARDHLVAAVPERAHDAERGQHLHQRVGDLVGPVVLERQRQQPLVHAVEALASWPSRPKALTILVPASALVQHHVELGDLLLRALVDAVKGAGRSRRTATPTNGEDEQGDEGQPPLPHEHHAHERRHHRHLPHRHHQPVGRTRAPAG